MNPENRYKYDPTVEKVEVLEQVGVNFAFGYQKMFRVLTVSSRDCYVYNYYNMNDDGSIIHCVYVDEKDDMPDEPGCVRMSIPVGGMKFTPNKEDPSKCSVTVYMEVNVGGYIPEFIQK